MSSQSATLPSLRRHVPERPKEALPVVEPYRRQRDDLVIIAGTVQGRGRRRQHDMAMAMGMVMVKVMMMVMVMAVVARNTKSSNTKSTQIHTVRGHGDGRQHQQELNVVRVEQSVGEAVAMVAGAAMPIITAVGSTALQQQHGGGPWHENAPNRDWLYTATNRMTHQSAP